jgi:hypothetical protein
VTMKKLRCTNKDCESHKNDQHLFEVDSVSIGDERDIQENLKECAAKEFRCSFCGSEAELKEVEDQCSHGDVLFRG